MKICKQTVNFCRYMQAEYARYAVLEPQTKGWVEVRLSNKEPEYIVHRK